MTVSNEIHKVVTHSQCRRRWPLAEKKRIIEESYLPGMSLSLMARKYQIAPSQVFAWRKDMEQGGLVGMPAEEGVAPKSEVKALKSKVMNMKIVISHQNPR